jgi:hypothetical protein
MNVRSKILLRTGLLFLLVQSFLGCVSLRSVSLTQIPVDRSDRVSAQTEKFYFLGIGFDTDYVDELNNQLRGKCKDGRIAGILTKDESINYFLGIFSKRRVSANGFCLKKG